MTSPDVISGIPLMPESIATETIIEIPFITAVTESESGVSGRKSVRPISLRRYTISINPDDVQTVISLITASKGARFPVALRDWSYTTATYKPCVFVDDSLTVTVIVDRIARIEDLHLREIPETELADILAAWSWSGTEWTAI